MKRFLAWLGRFSTGGRSTAAVVIDLPAQFGDRLRLEQVRALFTDVKNREMVNAFAQVLWMHRAAAAEDVMNTGQAGKSSEQTFHSGRMAAVDGALADVTALLYDRAADDPEMKRWFKSDEAVEG